MTGINSSNPVDLLIVGGGINGAGIARDAAGRGLSVLLVEQHDLAAHTSSASTKLVHGGLRYLEYYEFRLVREALRERERLLAIAPHIIWPLEFVLPHSPEQRPAWMIRAGLFLYDHLARRQRLPASRAVRFGPHPAAATLKPAYRRGFTYADCWVEDSRLVVLNALDAAERGAVIRTRTRLVSAQSEGALWHATLQTENGPHETITARAIVNAAGPWVGEILADRLGRTGGKTVRMVKGSHIIVPRLYEGEHAFILQNTDGRIVFVIPYEQNFTLIGTTDIPYEDDPGDVKISAEETKYLCDSVSRYFRTEVTPADVVRSYAGVRPLYDDHAENAAAVTRDYVLEAEGGAGRPALLSVFGGKITTYRKLAEHALEKLLPLMGRPAGAGWTAQVPLPGGDMPADFAAYLATITAKFPLLPQHLLQRLVRAYGTRAETILGGAEILADLGEDLGGHLTTAEIDYLVAQEWARTPEDILWRRSKLALHVPDGTAERLAAYLKTPERAEPFARQFHQAG
ncbi:glycerol-3-phosphate dehydrogenase [Acidocella sp.]|jgi:glycerol-3-phosphate dehydrogenase|uniref:glycerol-3-phosphate dehydrogenase n=1 Tax=Acidocella sp. TaxID=50710 RepID=UPI002F3E62F3